VLIEETPMRQPVYCCGHAFTRRSWMSTAVATATGALLGGWAATRSDAATTTAARATDAHAFLKENIAVDVHTHAGPTGVTSRHAPGDDLARSMRSGGMAIVVGVDHVSVGSDHSAGRGVLSGYDDFIPVVAAMLGGGFTPAETAKIVSGNYLRLFAASTRS
jgi:microsomal dipeptidase-like Zn-dependent dipeptidase